MKLILASMTVIVFIALIWLSNSHIVVLEPEQNKNAYASPEPISDKELNVHNAQYTSEAPWTAFPSLSDVDLDFHLKTDNHNNLIVDTQIKDLFDAYLSALGEAELARIVTQLRAHLAQSLPQPALDQSYDLLNQYIEYQKAILDLQNYLDERIDSMSQFEMLELKNAKMADLRHDYFHGASYDAFFGTESQYDQFMLESLKIQQNEDLSIEDKEVALEAIEARLPESIRQSRTQATQFADVYADVERLRESGASEAEVFRARAHVLGQSAAQSLSQLDREHQHWQGRVDAFIQRQQEIEGSTLSREDKDRALQQVLTEHFTDIEALRVQAIASSQ